MVIETNNIEVKTTTTDVDTENESTEKKIFVIKVIVNIVCIIFLIYMLKNGPTTGTGSGGDYSDADIPYQI
jgi:hypothetical protein